MTLLESQLDNCQDGIRENNQLIKKYEELYDSLKQFKHLVTNSQNSFLDTANEKKKYLSELDIDILNCRTADKYNRGMTKALNKVGMQCVNMTYAALLLSIDIKLAQYITKIEKCEIDNKLLGKTMEELNKKITEKNSNSEE